jgi:hypothetical protein
LGTVGVLLSFALLDTNDHALTVDIGGFQVHSFRYPQARRVTDRQNRPVLDMFYALQKLQNFLRAENHR